MRAMWSEDELRVAALSEQRVAQLRLVVILTVWIAYALLTAPGALSWLGAVLGYAVGAVALSIVYYRPWLSWVSSAMDTSLVTVLLISFIITGTPVGSV